MIEKPKWLQNLNDSHSASPQSEAQYSARKHISVTPFKKRGRKAGTRGNRGGKAYVPRPSLSLVVTRTGSNDYHYGSDFDSASDSGGSRHHLDDLDGQFDPDEQLESDVDVPPPYVNESDEASEDQVDSDSSYSADEQVRRPERIATPPPFWLRDVPPPFLEIPPSSEDLPLPSNLVLPACAVYEVLRKFAQEVRLSPFRLEDFMEALRAEELTSLLSEIHVQLLKAMLREEDAQQTWFGPLDQKDSTNSMLHFSDTLTWPEVLRVYLQSDPLFVAALRLLEDCEYPFVSCQVRLQVLKFLTDQFICNTAVRQDILSEGNIKYDDHCRICYKVGDLLCCETCPAVYHLHCLDPPLEQVPNEDWQCPVCVAQQCRGVTDCKSDLEKSGLLCRQDCLGYDRQGRKYWFVARRLFIEETGDWNAAASADGPAETSLEASPERTGPVRYYSSPHQFEQVMATLDRGYYERELYRELHNLRPEIMRQMALTVALTDEFKGNNKSYLEIDEASSMEAKAKLAMPVAKKETLEDDDDVETDVVNDVGDAKTDAQSNGIKMEPQEEKAEAVNNEEEVVEECGVEVDDDFMQQLTVESEEKQPDGEPAVELEKKEPTEEIDVGVNEDGAAAAGTDAAGDGAAPGSAAYSTRSKTGSIAPRNYVDMKRRESSASPATVKDEEVKKTEDTPTPQEVIFKLGMEGRIKSYVNQYSVNSSALNKVQAAEERDRKRYLSHKFSLSGAAEFRWVGAACGTRVQQLHTIRATLLQLHAQLLGTFMHPNWNLMRKPWIAAVNACVSPRDLGRALSVLAACIRPVAFTQVWHESLGHVRLQRQTALEREEKKKVDKKEKKEKELEEEMHRLHTVHYTRGLKHQIWKQKGEEYRLHAQWGWQWLSSTRPIRRADARQCGLRAGPWRVVTSVEVDGEQRLQQVEATPATRPLELAADDAALQLVDVTAGLTEASGLRRVYPKVARRGKLDALLDWRLRLKDAEEKQLSKLAPPSQTVSKESTADENVEVDVEGVDSGRRLAQLEAIVAAHRCYAQVCDSTCYSTTCRQLVALRAEEAERKRLAAEAAEAAAADRRRVYSSADTSLPVSLKRCVDTAGAVSTVGETSDQQQQQRVKKKRVPVKYPMMSPYMTKSRKRTIFVLADHELRHLARRGAQGFVQGFHHGCKTNSTAWPYPSARPVFRTCWFYRTTGLASLSAAALQLRILWASLRWDDMAAKSSAHDGKNQLTTDTEIVTTDVLRHRHIGRFLERTQYFQRRVVIPLDVPKTVREVAPSRSGLRKRKLVEAPRLSQPIVSEDWIDEDRLDLWEIRQYHERIERAASGVGTTPTMTRFKTAAAASPQTTAQGASKTAQSTLTMEEMKEKAEQQLRAQRAAHQQKSGGTPNANVVRLALPVGKMAGAAGPRPSLTALLASAGATGTAAGTPAAGTRRILVTKEGTPVVRAAQPLLIASAGGAATPTPGPANKIQITRGADGKIQIRGLQPGQQLMRLGDGRFTIVQTTSSAQAAAAAAAAAGGATPATAVIAAATPTAAATADVAAKTTALKATPVAVTAAAPVTAAAVKGGVTGQLVVSGNTTNLVQQLAAGKLQLATVNGQQVLISGQAPASNIPATAIATTAVPTAIAPAGGAATAGKQALVLQSPQGTRIVVQNFQGGQLTPQQLAAIQEQLKTQLMRAQGTKAAASPALAPAKTTANAKGKAAPAPTETSPAEEAAAAAPNSPEKSNKFVVTPDFIQQAIRKSLKQENLHPDIEQKLLHLQRFQERQKKDGDEEPYVAVTHQHGVASGGRKRTLSDASWNEAEGLAYDGHPAVTSVATPASRSAPRKVARVAVETPRASLAAAAAATPPTRSAPSAASAAASAASNEEREAKARERSMKAQQRARERRHQQQAARLQGLMARNAEQLKKDMLRKRALLEKELRQQIHKELSAARANLPSPTRAPAAAAAVAERLTPAAGATPPSSKAAATPPSAKAAATPAPAKPAAAAAVAKTTATSPSRSQKRKAATAQTGADKTTPSPKKARSSNAGAGGGGGRSASKKKLYCVCRTPYDNSKFYVGCDLCSNWFHGSCVGITEDMSQTMSEFVCDGCRAADEGKEKQLYCLCQQPYDESQFYICCDRCQDWFHGRCVGVLQTESQSIDEYVCPRCDPDAPFNYANMRTLCPRDYDEMRKLVRQLQQHKSAWPFREPVSARDVPDYHRIIKEPMDLRTVDQKIQDRRYQRLADFIGDVTKIFDNCRYYNAKESNIARCATTLEQFFGPRLKTLRDSMADA